MRRNTASLLDLRASYSGHFMALNETLNNSTLPDKMPVLFVGHGNPMNAITDNSYSQSWKSIGEQLPVPNAILCMSAHWLTKGTFVTMAEQPKTLHDFGGFPKELFAVQYPATGAPEYARRLISAIKSITVQEDFAWGLDHGAWSILKNMYPNANIPVFQMSIDATKPPLYHYNLAKELSDLRNQGVLILASGNIVHNLGILSWDGKIKAFDWALEFDAFVKNNIIDNNPLALIDYQKLGKLAALAHPSNEHYLPLLYALGLRENTDSVQFFNEEMDLGSLSMRSVVFG
jgi:4,5-DOPA dioxygenase extradiol